MARLRILLPGGGLTVQYTARMKLEWKTGDILYVKLHKKGVKRTIVAKVEALEPGRKYFREVAGKYRVKITLTNGVTGVLTVTGFDIFAAQHTLVDPNQPYNGTQERSDQEGPGQAP